MNLEGKTAVVTGAAAGLGREIALQMSQAGAKVAIMDVDLENAEQTSQEINLAGGKSLALKVDIRKGLEVTAGFEKVFAEFGRLDVLVNNAGIFRVTAGFKELQEDEWSNMLDINVHGVIRCCQAVIPHMERNQSGKIINIASISGVAGIKDMAIYSATKGALIAFTKALAMDEGKYDINVNCVSPGQLKSYEDESKGTFLKRSGELPVETAKLVCFLASADADFITGANYIIDGGRTLGVRSA